MTVLRIQADESTVASLEATGEGPRITYEPEWRTSASAFPISLTMPLTGEQWGPEIATPWLMNLLPEGDPLRTMTRALGIAREDILGLLKASGRDLAGALAIRDSSAAEAPAQVAIANDAQLERIISELPSRPFLVGDEGVAMSLAGAQDKLPVIAKDGQLAIPINGSPSTHILKPDNPRLPGSVQNEALCMVLARRCGLPVAAVTTGATGTRTYLLVTRHDRVEVDGRVHRIHQEDFCQSLGISPAAKYEHNGTGAPGPGTSRMFALLREYMTGLDITRFLDAVIFNIAIGNVDSHAKNYSVLLRPGRTELAPLYDLMSGLAWSNITQNHAQDIGGKRRGRRIYARHWRVMAEEAGLSARATVRRVLTLADRIQTELPAARDEVANMPAGAGAMLDVFVTEIAARARTVGLNARLDGGDEPEELSIDEAGATGYGG